MNSPRNLLAATLAVLAVALPVRVQAQGGRGGRGGAPAAPVSPQAGALVDLTGYWVAVVTEDWRFRMVTPPKGDYASVPLNPEGRRVADTWDPAKDEAAGEQCRSYGAANIMRVPGRVHVTWDNENTLKVEMDAGTQTRLFHFGAPQPPTGAPDWQGYSVAQWEGGPTGRGGGQAPAPSGPGATREVQNRGGTLKVTTTHLRAGYLRKNGVPYSANATVTEYYDRTMEPNGDSWLVVTTIVDDPQYLQQPFITSTHFKREADGSKWSPAPCTAK